MKPWSISTTVRNPERLRGFLKILEELEGEPFNPSNQKKYQILLIKNKLYKPTDLSFEEIKYFEDIEKEMPFKVAEEIFNKQNYKDPAMRGRNSAAPLNKMGLAIAKNSLGKVIITDLGKYFLSDDYDLGDLFFIHFLKWQLPNPDSSSFLEKEGFNIKPFVGTLHLINEVNKLWGKAGNKPVGITKEEFSIFAQTLIDHRNIKQQAEKIIDYRNKLSSKKGKDVKIFKDKYKTLYVSSFLETKDLKKVKALIKNLKDYGDNTIRYFRGTRYLYIRGGGFHVDLEPRRRVEIKKILETDDGSPKKFRDTNEYLEYIADINTPTLPWETQEELHKICSVLIKDVDNYIEKLNQKNIKIKKQLPTKKLGNLSLADLIKHTEDLRIFRRELQQLETHHNSQDTNKIKEYINLLKNIHKSENKKSIELERLTTLALNALNDAINIQPNYPVGDDNEPTFTAPANKPDIECFYQTFNAVCEVTMLTNRAQWYNEGQPVMRHVRDFEKKHSNKKVYCLFVAPKLHQDTLETFWMSIKYGYKGNTQKIAPISITQLIKILETLVKIKNYSQKTFNHNDLADLYEKILDITNQVAHSDEWAKEIPNTVDQWSKSLIAKSK